MNMVDVLKFTRSQQYDVTLNPILWMGTKPPYIYNIAVPAVTEFNNVEVLPAVNITDDELKNMNDARIVGGSQTDGSFTLKAYGKKPSHDIPLLINVRGGMV